MKFCHECGNKIGHQEKFCANCGTPLEVESAEDVKNKYSNIYARGILVTDTQKLSELLGCNRLDVESLFYNYVSLLQDFGIDYQIVDCNSYQIKGGAMKGKKVSLDSTQHTFEHYIALINDFYNYGFAPEQQPSFLFIVGDSSVVPMYKGVNYLYMNNSNFSDKDVDSDLPYCYITPSNNVELMEEGLILNKEQKFHLGRLPLGSDWTLETLSSYLDNVIEAHKDGGITIESCYGQIDPHWAIESDIVTTKINEKNLFVSKATQKGFTYNNIHTTPNVTLSNIGSYFHSEASLLYFNMHGSRHPESPQFFGYGLDDKSKGGGGISPLELSSMTKKNIVVTEACYGAKFEGLRSGNSMVLSALKQNTLCYLGSSRIALAAAVNNYSNPNAISCADIIANEFINNILNGNLSGAAFSEAKQKFLSRISQLSHEDLLTITEFNLFGDPTIPINIKSYKEKFNKQSDYSSKIGCENREIYSSEQSSILSVIRGAVDKNIAQIRDTLNNYMAANYGIEPKTLSHICKTTYKNGKSELKFTYKSCEGEQESSYIAITDTKGVINRVLTTK